MLTRPQSALKKRREERSCQRKRMMTIVLSSFDDKAFSIERSGGNTMFIDLNNPSKNSKKIMF